MKFALRFASLPRLATVFVACGFNSASNDGIKNDNFPPASDCRLELEKGEKRNSRNSHKLTEQNDGYDIVIIGGGLSGLSSALHLSLIARAPPRILVVESLWGAGSSPASSGNSGLGHTGYDAPVGSLERRLLRRSIEIHPTLYRAMGLSIDRGHVNKSGGSVVRGGAKELAKVLEENHQAGDLEATIEDGQVHCPREAVVEPFLVSAGYAEMVRRLDNVTLLTGAEVVNVAKRVEGGQGWELILKEKNKRCTKCGNETEREWRRKVKGGISSDGGSSDGILNFDRVLTRCSACDKDDNDGDNDVLEKREIVRGDFVINAGGLYVDEIEKMRVAGCEGGDRREERREELEIRPRKGQFLVLKPTRMGVAPEFIIEQCPSEETKGVIVWTTLYGNVIVGPTADDVQSKTDCSTDKQTMERLAKEAIKLLKFKSGEGKDPKNPFDVLRENGLECVGSYSGIRTASNRRDYTIDCDSENGWLTVGGIRSTGLSSSPAIGEYVAELYRDMLLKQNRLKDTASSNSRDEFKRLGVGGVEEERLRGITACALENYKLENSNYNKLPALPRAKSLWELRDNYKKRHDGRVEIWEGAPPTFVWHPISRFGMNLTDLTDLAISKKT